MIDLLLQLYWLRGKGRRTIQMIDWIKILSLPISVSDLLKNLLLKFTANAFDSGEENGNNQTCVYKGIVITLNKRSNARKLKGSIHKYWNNGSQNHDNFPYSGLANAIIDLTTSINVDPKECVLNNIEFGVNLVTNFNPTDMIQDLIQHNGVPFYPMPKGIGKCCRHSQYTIKIYNKGLQYNLPYYVLRIEIRVETMDYLHSKGISIKTLDDLTYLHNLRQLARNLLDRFDEILFFDSSIQIYDLPNDEQQILWNARAPEYWEHLNDKNARDIFRRKYKRILETHGKLNWKQIVRPMIINKLDELLSN